MSKDTDLPKQNGYWDDEPDYEYEEKLQKHRRGVRRRTRLIVIFVLLLVVTATVVIQMKTYTQYLVLSTHEWEEESATNYVEFGTNILKYSNDGASYLNAKNEIVWNESFEMEQPITTVCESYAAIAPKGGREIIIFDEEGVVGRIETTLPIMQIDIANQGSVAVLLKDSGTYYVSIYDKSGTELVKGSYHTQKSGVPLDLALSDDGKKMAVSLCSINNGRADSTILFYNFDKVGQNEIDNNVGSDSYENLVIPQMDFLSNNTMVAVGDKKILIYKGTQKPALQKEIEMESEALSVFYGNGCFGYVAKNQADASADALSDTASGDSTVEDEPSYRFYVYSQNGTKKMSRAFDMEYDTVRILKNKQICILNEQECLIYSQWGIKRFEGTFENGIRGVRSTGLFHSYIFVLPDGMQRVILK
jgi:hypothetical protein